MDFKALSLHPILPIAPILHTIISMESVEIIRKTRIDAKWFEGKDKKNHTNFSRRTISI